MASLEQYLDERLARGRSYLVGDEARATLGVSQRNFAATVTRLINKGRLANPRHGFFLILRPEDRIAGAPDPARWIDPLMKHQKLAYRVSLLRAAAFHGSSHQAAMVFQVHSSQTIARLGDRPPSPPIYLPSTPGLHARQFSNPTRSDEDRGRLCESGRCRADAA